MMDAETVHQVEIVVEKPIVGVADFAGAAHRFWLLGFSLPVPGIGQIPGLGDHQWTLKGPVPEHDLYELTPLSGLVSTKIIAHGLFRETQSPVGFAAGPSPRSYEVRWLVLTITERLDRVLAAQAGAGPEFGLPTAMCFLVGAVFVNDADLAQLQPYLTFDAGLPGGPYIGRYRSVAVFPLSARAEAILPVAEYQGVLYEYCQMGHVN